MPSTSLRCIWLACLALSALACGDDSSEPPHEGGGGSAAGAAGAVAGRASAGNSGAASGSGASAGRSGNGGGSAGRGSAGTSAGRSGGQAGNAGTSGDAGMDASAGTGAEGGEGGTASGEVVIVGVGSFGLRMRSEGGMTWTRCGGPEGGDDHTPELLRNVGYGNGVFMAVGGAANSMFMRSTDGTHWQEDLLPTDSPNCSNPNVCEDWMGAVAYGDGTWLAAGGNGSVARSEDDGLTWHGVSTTPFLRPTLDMAYGDGVFVIVTDEGPLYVTADEGENWTTHDLWDGGTEVVYGGGVFIALGSGSACFIGTDQGTQWDPCPSALNGVTGFAHDGERWAGVKSGGYVTSDDGQEWSQHAATNVPSSLRYDGEAWIGLRGQSMWRSTDLANWSQLNGSVGGFRNWTLGAMTRPTPSGAAACVDRF